MKEDKSKYIGVSFLDLLSAVQKENFRGVTSRELRAFSDDVVAALAEGQIPDFSDEDDERVFEVFSNLAGTVSNLKDLWFDWLEVNVEAKSHGNFRIQRISLDEARTRASLWSGQEQFFDLIDNNGNRTLMFAGGAVPPIRRAFLKSNP